MSMDMFTHVYTHVYTHISMWRDIQMHFGTRVFCNQVKYAIGMTTAALMHTSSCLKTFGPEDLVLCIRDKKVEVWTNRAFKANELILGPDTTEIKDRYFTHNRSVRVPGSQNQLPQNKEKGMEAKALVLDGRLRSAPDKAKDRPFSLFFCVGKAALAKDANMDFTTTDLSITFTLKLPGAKVASSSTLGNSQAPQVPIMHNPQKIPAKTKLLYHENPFEPDVTEPEPKKAKT